MDEVLEKLETTNITIPDAGGKSNFDNLYKNWGKTGNQEERRKELLDFQKCKRNTNLDNYRGILDLVNAVEENDIFGSYDKPRYRPSIYVAGFHRASPSYKNVLMLSEWMVEKPEDFETNWYVMPCPKGIRMLVVANNGITKCFTKYGHFKFEKPTALPGGNPYDTKKKLKCCVLDCFYSEKTKTMYIVDLLAWVNQPMTDGETEFRHYWLTSQLNEIPELETINKFNKIKFKLLPKVSCDKESFNKFMMTFPHFEDQLTLLDGLLFYHKKAHYFAGETPLVGWLFPFMVPEIIGSDITMNPVYLLEKPEDYIDQADYIKKFELKYSKKTKRNRRQSMDTSTDSSINDSKEAASIGDGDKATPRVEHGMEAEEIPISTTTVTAAGGGDTKKITEPIVN